MRRVSCAGRRIDSGMDRWIIVGVVVVVCVVGTFAAMFWWRLAAKIKPYKDEAGRTRRARGPEEHVVVIKSGDAPGPRAGP